MACLRWNKTLDSSQDRPTEICHMATGVCLLVTAVWGKRMKFKACDEEHVPHVWAGLAFSRAQVSWVLICLGVSAEKRQYVDASTKNVVTSTDS
jgi:hypothetical protein